MGPALESLHKTPATWVANHATRCLTLVVLLSLVVSGTAQQTGTLSKTAAAVKQKAESLAPQAAITVVRKDTEEEFGTFVSNDAGSFTLYDVDLKRNVTLQYSEVNKIKDGYGGYNSFQHRHTDRTKNLVIVAVVLGGLAALIAVAAASK
jgi:hypothetical protein